MRFRFQHKAMGPHRDDGPSIGRRRRHGMGAGPGRFRHGRRRLFDSGELRLMLLSLIAEQPRHGYDLIRAMEDLSGGSYAPSPGMVYPLLAMMAEMGRISAIADDGAKKSFAITDAGKAELAAPGAGLEHLRERLKRLAAEQEKVDAMPVRRAMQNLRAALEGRLAQDGVTRATVLETAALIDEAAGKIERL